MFKTLSIEGTQVFIQGHGKRALVMLHGWPDTHESWQRQVDYFKQDYLCITFTMPGFAKGDAADYSLGAMVERIRAIVDAVSPDEKVILLAHDWGCVFGYEYAMRYSQRVEKMIGMDVGDVNSEHLQNSLSLTQKLMVFTYQVVLATGFMCGKTLGTATGKLVASALQAKSNRHNIHRGMSMPYAMRWFGLNGGLKNLLPMAPTFPFYYCYATQKPMMFHSPQWLETLLESEENKVEAYDCGHWIMVDKASKLNTAVAKWLAQ